MIFVDANVFLRFLGTPMTPEDHERKAFARQLLRLVRAGEIEATTGEVVLHEVCFVLGSRRHYGQPVETIVMYLRSILSWPGWTFPPGDKAIYLHALDIFSEYPKLEFSDSVIAARTEAMGAQLATFDERLGGMPFVDRWDASASEGG